MNAAAAPGWERRLFSFVRLELAPSTSRWHAAIRITLACELCVALIASLHIPDGEFLLVTLLVVSQLTAWASVNKAVLRCLGTLGGGVLAILAVICFADKPWFLFSLQAVVIAATLFFSRTTTAPYAFLIAGVTYVMVAPEYVATPSFNLEQALWRTSLTTLGALIGSAAQILLWPTHPEALLLRDLAQRLAAVERSLRRLAAANLADAGGGLGDPVTAAGMAAQLDLLGEAEAMSRWLRQRHAEQIKVIVEVQRLVSACVRLEKEAIAGAVLSPAMRRRLTDVAAGAAHIRRSIEARRPPAAIVPPVAAVLEPGDAAALAAAEEMEEALAALPRALAFLDTSPDGRGVEGERLPRQPLARKALWTPACTLANAEAVQTALKAAFGASICGLIYEACDWTDVAPVLLTCLLVAQSTVGAGRRKAMLRVIGAGLGALGALATILVLMPNMESVASLLTVTTVLFGAAAWVSCGSSRIAYVGLQMAIAVALVLVNGQSPTTDLTVGWDRLFGIGLGIAVMGTIDVLLWPVFARAAIRAKLARALALLAELHRTSAAGDAGRVHSGAIAIYRTLADAVALEDDLDLEPERRPEETAERRAVLRLTSLVQDVFLQVLAVWRHRDGLTETAFGALDARVTGALDEIAAAVAADTPIAAAVPPATEIDSRQGVAPEAAAVYRELLGSVARLGGGVVPGSRF